MAYYESESEEEPIDFTGDFGENSFANIFGRPPQPCKPFAKPSGIDLTDPLRTIKVSVKSILVANLSMSAEQVANEFLEMYGTPLQFESYGFNSVDELLSSFTDVCSSYRDGAGNVTYVAITDERHEDLQHLIRRQIISPEVTARRTGRLPCTNRMPHSPSPKTVEAPSPSDIRCRAPWLKDRVASTKAIGQFPCAPNANRIVFNDDGPKCKERCLAIVNMIKEIGERSPDNVEIRCHIEALKNYYWQHTGLSIWGKIMPIAEYAEAWRQPEFHEFWRIMKEERKSEEDEDRYYIVVPTDPSKNYFHLLPPELRPTMNQDNQRSDDGPIFDNHLCTRVPRDFESAVNSQLSSHSISQKQRSVVNQDVQRREDKPILDSNVCLPRDFDRTMDTYYASLQESQNCRTVPQNSRTPVGRTDLYDFRPPFTSSANSTYDGTNVFGSNRADLLPPDISNITQESSIGANPVRICYGNIRGNGSLPLDGEESYLDYPFTVENNMEDTFNTVDESLGQYNDERCPEYQFPEENDLEYQTYKQGNEIVQDYSEERCPEYQFSEEEGNLKDSYVHKTYNVGNENAPVYKGERCPEYQFSEEENNFEDSFLDHTYNRENEEVQAYQDEKCPEYQFSEEENNSEDHTIIVSDFSSSVLRSELSSSYREKIPSDNESVEKSPETIPTGSNSPIESEWDPLLEQLNQQLGKCHLKESVCQKPDVNNKERPVRNLATSGIRRVNRHLESHARDCRRRDPLKPCNTLPTDRDDLKARQLSDVPPEIKSNSSIAPAAVASNSSITTSEAVSTIPTVTVSTSSETSTPVVSQNAIVSSSLSSTTIPSASIIDPFAVVSNISIATPENRIIRFAEEDDIYTISDTPSDMSWFDDDFSIDENVSMETSETNTTMLVYENEPINEPTVESQSIQRGVSVPNDAQAKLEQASSEDRITELMDMLVKKVNQMPSSDGRMSTFHCMLAFGHMLKSTTKLKLNRMIDNLEYALDLEQEHNDMESGV